jgi:hypothetical protein
VELGILPRAVLQINPGLPDDFSIPPGTALVQFRKRLNQSDYGILAAALHGRPEVKLRVYHSGATELTDLDFLSYFPEIRKLSIELFWLSNIDGFQAIRELDEFTFGWTRKKSYSLAFLARFPAMRKLYVEGHKKDIEVLASLSKLETLTMRSITLASIDFLAALPQLSHLEIKLGGTSNLQGLAALDNLKYLELWLIKGLSDLSIIAEIRSLEFLFLQALKNVKQLPSLRNLTKLKEVYLQTMTGLTDLQPIADAPSLEILSLIDMTKIDPNGLRCFVGHPKLREFTGGLGSLKRNAYAEALIGLPPRVSLPPGARERAALDILYSLRRLAD